jgi:hypothetical protein
MTMSRHNHIDRLRDASGLIGPERQIYRACVARLIPNGCMTRAQLATAHSAGMAAVEASRNGVVTLGTPNQRVRGPSAIREWHRSAAALKDRIRDEAGE